MLTFTRANRHIRASLLSATALALCPAGAHAADPQGSVPAGAPGQPS